MIILLLLCGTYHYKQSDKNECMQHASPSITNITCERACRMIAYSSASETSSPSTVCIVLSGDTLFRTSSNSSEEADCTLVSSKSKVQSRTSSLARLPVLQRRTRVSCALGGGRKCPQAAKMWQLVRLLLKLARNRP
jgi:hypothetical protein